MTLCTFPDPPAFLPQKEEILPPLPRLKLDFCFVFLRVSFCPVRASPSALIGNVEDSRLFLSGCANGAVLSSSYFCPLLTLLSSLI